MTEGVDIPLPATDAVFRVLLPGTMNEDFNMDLMSSLNVQPDSDGNARIDSIKFQRERKRLFFERCILGAKGLPEGMDVDTFFKTYPLAGTMVFEKATELATIADTEANDALGKLKPTPNGKSSGEGEQNNTKTS